MVNKHKTVIVIFILLLIRNSKVFAQTTGPSQAEAQNFHPRTITIF